MFSGTIYVFSSNIAEFILYFSVGQILPANRNTPSPIDPETIQVPVGYEPDPADLALSSIPGQEMFDPRKRKFSEEELKPQPMIKKARKVFIPDDLKVNWNWWRVVCTDSVTVTFSDTGLEHESVFSCKLNLPDYIRHCRIKLLKVLNKTEGRMFLISYTTVAIHEINIHFLCMPETSCMTLDRLTLSHISHLLMKQSDHVSFSSVLCLSHQHRLWILQGRTHLWQSPWRSLIMTEWTILYLVWKLL